MTMGRIKGRGRSAVATAIVAMVVAGCNVTFQMGDLGEAVGGRPEDASTIVERWLELARTGQEDHGWWLLHTNARADVIGSIEVYRDALSEPEWSGFEYEVRDARLHDGHFHVELRIAGGRQSVPEPVCRWGLIQFTGLDDVIGETTVRIPPLSSEPAGILAGRGGC
jgi:hypothetical protein